MNILKAISSGMKILEDNFILTAGLDSEILMAQAIRKNRKYLLLNPNEKVNLKDLENFKLLIKKRANKKPIAYLTNKKFFWKSKFYVTNDTLIPRPDTELVVESALRVSKNKNRLNILDIGIGSGCILLSILKERKNFYGTGVDVSKKCLNICKINAINLNLSSRLKLIKSDVDKFFIGKYDLIVSNPPYIKKFDLKYLESDVIKFEPKW